MLGLKEGTVVLVKHDPDWAQVYETEKRRIRTALADLALDIQHCGSTAVPDIRAKPILDLLVGVALLSRGHECVRPLQEIGYDYLGDELVPNEHFFGKGAPRTHHLHLVEWHGSSWHEKVLFRDRLRADREVARLYEARKMALAARFPNDRASYTKAKATFIAGVLIGRPALGDTG